MALKITDWDFLKILLFICDISLLILNVFLFILTTYQIYNEYYGRGSFKLFFRPFIITIINIIIDIFMNKTNIKMKYAGHNRYGMITRFFMIYFVMTVIIFSDQRAKYILKGNTKKANKYIFRLGVIDIGLIFISMILSFFIIDVQSFRQVLVKKKRRKTEISLKPVESLQDIEIPDIK